MALSASFFTVKDTATTGNVNSGGFNPSNSNMLTDLACDTGTGNTASPVVSSASYNFVAGDVGRWVYVKAGTNWTPGWYEIASVASNKATLKAAIGEAQQYLNTLKKLNTVVGCATTGTPTGGTFTIDYSQSDTAIVNGVADFASVGSSTTLTSATAAFTPVMVGNMYHQTTTGTGGFGVVGWYEIVSYTSATAVVLDRTPNSGTASVACTGYIGGAARLNALEDAMFESFAAGTKTYIKAGTYNVSGNITIAVGVGTATNLNHWIGYTTIPGDYTTLGAAKPLINMAGNSCSFGNFLQIFHVDFTGTGTNVTVTNATNYVFNSKATNTSTTANRAAHTGLGFFDTCEFTSQFGYGFSHTGSSAVTRLRRCYIHDSAIGLSLNSAATDISECIIANCTTAAIRNATTTTNTTLTYSNNTIYGRLSTPTGIGIDHTSASAGGVMLKGNIVAGCTTGVSFAALLEHNTSFGTNFYGNTTNATNFNESYLDTYLDPAFTDVTEIAISNGTLTGGTAVLTSSGADFSSVQDGVDYFTLVSHTGGTGTFIGSYLITAHTTTTLTFNVNAGTSGSVTSIVGYIQTGHDFTPGANMKALDSVTYDAACTSFMDMGAVQREEPAGGSTATVSYAFQS